MEWIEGLDGLDLRHATALVYLQVAGGVHLDAAHRRAALAVHRGRDRGVRRPVVGVGGVRVHEDAPGERLLARRRGERHRAHFVDRHGFDDDGLLQKADGTMNEQTISLRPCGAS